MEKRVKDILVKHFTTTEVYDIIKGLKQLAFFKLPASTKYHCASKGGLAKHSMNVYEKSMELLPVLGDGTVTPKDIVITSLLHDLNKCMKGYTPNTLKSGLDSTVVPYKSDALLSGDGSLSCYLIRDVLGISLTPIQYNAIANHNIWEEDWKKNTILVHKNLIGYRLMLILVTADLYCSQVQEVL